MEIVERTIPVKELDPEEAETHFLEPGEIRTGPGGIYGVVVKSESNTKHSVLVKFGAEPVRDYLRSSLRWNGEIN